jgi:hypothetical protein
LHATRSELIRQYTRTKVEKKHKRHVRLSHFCLSSTRGLRHSAGHRIVPDQRHVCCLSL